MEGLEKPVPELEALLGLWRRRYGTRPLPEHPALPAAELLPWVRNIARIEFDREQFRVRSFGFDLIRRFGRESSNDYVENLALDIAASLREILLKAAESGAPALGAAMIAYGHDIALFSDLALPLARTGRHAKHLLFASYEVTASKEACL